LDESHGKKKDRRRLVAVAKICGS